MGSPEYRPAMVVLARLAASIVAIAAGVYLLFVALLSIGP